MSALVCVFFRHERLYGLIHQMQPLEEILCNLAAYVFRPTSKEFHRQPFLELSPTVRLIALGRSGLIQRLTRCPLIIQRDRRFAGDPQHSRMSHTTPLSLSV